MSDIKKIQEERNQNFKNIYESKIPNRVPVNITFPFGTIAELAGLNLLEAQWNPELIEPAVQYVSERMYTDVVPGGTSLRFPSYYQTLQSKSFVMGTSGVFQHPDVSGMKPEDFDYLISNPLECIYEIVIPRLYTGLDLNNPIEMMRKFTKAFKGYQQDKAITGAIENRIAEKYGYCSIVPVGSSGFTEAPYDFLADTLRGFRGVAVDIRRRPKQLQAAIEALYPIVLKKGMPKTISNYGHVFMPLHMPTFMREVDFANHWWPSFKRLLEEYASMGIHCKIFCEDNWDRYLDYLNDLPTNTVLLFEYGTPKRIKEKVGKKHIISGLYPVTYFKNHTKEECVDLAKELIDTLAPGGKYIFDFDKRPLSGAEVDLEKFNVVTKAVHEYGVYTSNVGEVVGDVFHKEDYTVDPKNRNLDSRYYLTKEQMLKENPSLTETGADRMASIEDEIFDFLNFLLM